MMRMLVAAFLLVSVLVVVAVAPGMVRGDERVAYRVAPDPPAPVMSSPWVEGEHVYFATNEPANKIFKLEAATGNVVWSRTMGTGRNGMRDSIVVVDGLLHVGTDNNTFAALDAATGNTVWAFTPPPQKCWDAKWYRQCEAYSSPLIHAGRRFQGSEDATTRCFNATTGDLLWTQHAGDQVNNSPVVDPSGTAIWIAANDGFMYKLDVSTGKVLSKFQHCGSSHTKPAMDNESGILFFSCFRPDPDNPSLRHGGIVYALNTTSNKALWEHQGVGGTVLHIKALNMVVVGRFDGTAYAADPITGAVKWEVTNLPNPKEFFGPFVFDEERGRIYGATLRGMFYALQPETGELLWDFQAGGMIPVPMGPRLSSDKMLVFFGSFDKHFYALNL
ncbi:hypothetical protein PTSG_12669 [Salpingoeca rosetta]|uniref:Pyrrolo-quinoline quinone repeat domain-containing protein n=1 Tax=Salpingoeca rosetta (strain ATCC 50818 / BSB-021) TaxID=946362 RepID=F2UHP8_SALR5|nr:uncharacterized protein PTSG_12669 [Salpingoeca rosetta]EGD76647.1 hypothetical protein PTSG_12669 [Salpingoeca rosetta]|eukprot:XP_004991019.1 hypothetical protein PTSG_12669 [Salpingoeca rosetta]